MSPSPYTSSHNLKLRNKTMLYIFIVLTALLYALSFIRVEKQKWSTALHKQAEIEKKREAFANKKAQQSPINQTVANQTLTA